MTVVDATTVAVKEPTLPQMRPAAGQALASISLAVKASKPGTITLSRRSPTRWNMDKEGRVRSWSEMIVVADNLCHSIRRFGQLDIPRCRSVICSNLCRTTLSILETALQYRWRNTFHRRQHFQLPNIVTAVRKTPTIATESPDMSLRLRLLLLSADLGRCWLCIGRRDLEMELLSKAVKGAIITLVSQRVDWLLVSEWLPRDRL